MARNLVLDLEGTLWVSYGSTLCPRPGLYGFLEFAYRHFDQVAVYTLLSEVRAKGAVQALVNRGFAPPVFLERFLYIQGPGGVKDLTYFEGTKLEETWIVDDSPQVIPPSQKDRWIQIASFEPAERHQSAFGSAEPGPPDQELLRVQKRLQQICGLAD